MFNEQPLRALYRFLGHLNSFVRVGTMDYQTGKFEDSKIHGEQEFIDYARKYDGTRNVFIGRASRDCNGKPTHCSTISFDVDPIREKGCPSNNEQHLSSLNAGRFIQRRFPGGYLCSSGNGALLLYQAGVNLLADVTYYKREAVLIKELNNLVGGKFNVKIDATSYAEAVIKAIGTMSTKGEPLNRRRSRWLDHPISPYRRCDSLLRRLGEIKVDEFSGGSSEAINIKQLESKFGGDRSEADYGLVSYLHRSGAKPEVALQALRLNPLGRRSDVKDQARIIGKIYGEEAAGNASPSYFEALRSNDNLGGIQSGIPELDRRIKSLPIGELTTVAARTGYGKSSFASTVAENLRKTKRVLYFSTEMPLFNIMHKFLSCASGISLTQILERSFTGEQIQLINAYEKDFKEHPINVCDEFMPTLQIVESKINSTAPDLVVFDHISQVSTAWDEVAKFTRGLKELAVRNKVPVLLLAELNEPPRGKEGEIVKSVRSDIRGSQEILFLSALFIIINNPFEVKGDIQPVELSVVKNRYGLSGIIATASVNKLTGKFS